MQWKGDPEKLAKTLETISHTLHILDEKGEEDLAKVNEHNEKLAEIENNDFDNQYF